MHIEYMTVPKNSSIGKMTKNHSTLWAIVFIFAILQITMELVRQIFVWLRTPFRRRIIYPPIILREKNGRGNSNNSQKNIHKTKTSSFIMFNQLLYLDNKTSGLLKYINIVVGQPRTTSNLHNQSTIRKQNWNPHVQITMEIVFVLFSSSFFKLLANLIASFVQSWTSFIPRFQDIFENRLSLAII